MGSERKLIPVIDRLSLQSGSVEQALELFQSALTGEIGGAALLMEPAGGPLLWRSRTVAGFLESRLFPFRGFYTAPVMVGSRTAGLLVACFGSFGAPGKFLPQLTQHIARQLGAILLRTGAA